MSSPSQWNTPETACWSEGDSNWTPSKRPRASRDQENFRIPHERRARKIVATGVVNEEGVPLPSDLSKPHTILTLEEIYAIAQAGDRSVMRDYTELFITTGINSYETKAEYAWIYLRPNEFGELPITEERLKVLFPEWKLVLKLSQEKSSDSPSNPGTRINLLSSPKPGKMDITDSDLFYRTVEPFEPNEEADDVDLRKEIWDLRSDNWRLQCEVSLLSEKNERTASKLNQAEHDLNQVEKRINAFESPRLGRGKRTSDTAFAQSTGDEALADEDSLHGLRPGIERMSLADRLSKAIDDIANANGTYEDEEKSRQAKRRELLDQHHDRHGGPVRHGGCWIDKEARDAILASLTSQDDLSKLTLHGYGQFNPIPTSSPLPLAAVDLESHLISSMPSGLPNMDEHSQIRNSVWMPQMPEYPPLDDQPYVCLLYTSDAADEMD